MSPSIWRTIALSVTSGIFFTAFSAQFFRTCHRHKKIFASGHTMLSTKNTNVSHMIGIKHMKDIHESSNICSKEWRPWLPQCVDFSLCIVKNDWRRSPIWFQALNFLVQGLKNRVQFLFARAGYYKERNRYAISPFIKCHDCVQRILKTQHVISITCFRN